MITYADSNTANIRHDRDRDLLQVGKGKQRFASSLFPLISDYRDLKDRITQGPQIAGALCAGRPAKVKQITLNYSPAEHGCQRWSV